MAHDLRTSPDINLHIKCENSASERRVNPSWSLAHFKARLEPITGIPSAAQRLTLTTGSNNGSSITLHAADEENTLLESFPLETYAEIYVHDTRPAALRTSATLSQPLSDTEKYTLPPETYATLPDTVLAYKRAHKLGRFDPSAPDALAQQVHRIDREIEERGIAVGKRCRVLPAQASSSSSSAASEEVEKRGEVAYIGSIAALPGPEGAKWIGVRLDEPVGKNDGSVAGVKVFDAGGSKRGVVVRPERVECGDFKVLGLGMGEGEELEEL